MQLRWGDDMQDFNVTAWVGHSLSTTAILGALAGFFPWIAALAAFIWYSIQICESDTVKKYLAKRRAHKIARLKARVDLLEKYEKEDKK